MSAIVAGVAGKLIENQFLDRKALVQLHSTINELASFIFAIIAVAYFISWIKKSNINLSKFGSLWKIALTWEKIVIETPVIYILALVGLILISIGGALGGAISYGQDFDPFTHFIYSLFFH